MAGGSPGTVPVLCMNEAAAGIEFSDMTPRRVARRIALFPGVLNAKLLFLLFAQGVDYLRAGDEQTGHA